MFAGHYGNFPYSFFSGDINTCLGDSKVVLYDYGRIFCNGSLPAILDFSNVFLQENDLYDPKIEMVLDLFKDRGNYLLFSNPKIKDNILKRCKNFKTILSENINLFSDIPLSNIDDIFMEFKVDKIELSSAYIQNNIEELKCIKNKKNIIITLENECNNCLYDNFKQCKINEHNNQINFSNNSVFKKCLNKCFPVNIYNDILFYKSLGFNHFKIPPMFSYDLEQNNQFLLDLFIKKEFHDFFVDEYNSKGDTLWL